MNTTAKGSAKERRTCELLEADGWLVASRRHRRKDPGSGDLLCTKHGERPILVEVKASGRGPWQDFGPEERVKMRELAKLHNVVPILAWWKPRAREHELIDEVLWP